MNPIEYQQYDASGLADLLSRGEVSAVELVETAITIIEEKNPTLNAVVFTDFNRAVEAAKGTPGKSAFGGVPFLCKDLNTNVSQLPSTNGSRAFAEQVAETDGELVKRYRQAGLLILGKTNTPEFGLNFCTEPLLFGPTLHPQNSGVSVGGSSGGSAVAVTSGMVPMAHATDSGGSIRIPASNCGLFGLKPTRGRVPLGNDMPEGLAGFSTAHALSHSVRDSARLLDLSAGPVSGDPYIAPYGSSSYSDILKTTWRPLRIGFCSAGFAGERVHGDCQRQVADCAGLLETLGCQVEESAPPIDGLALRSAFDVLWSANVGVLVSRIVAANPGTAIEGLVEPVTLACAERSSRLTASDYVEAMLQIQQAGRKLGEYFNHFDVLLTPTLAHPPRPLGFLSMAMQDWSAYLDILLDEIPFTPLFNATGAPAASIPFGHSAEGLPVGLQLGAALGNEGMLLRLAGELECAAPWHQKI